MRISHKLLISLFFLALFAGGCGVTERVTSLMRPLKNIKPNFRPPAKPEKEPGAVQMEHDAVQPEMKAEHGIHYDPREWMANANYNPGTVDKLISSPGFQGLSQHTFAEAGGDHNVHLLPDGKTMVFATTRYSKNPQICIQSVSGLAVTLVTEDNMSDMMPKFSPKGDLIAWCSNRYGNWDILVQESNTRPDSRPRQLTRSTEDDIHPTWSPDQKLLAFSRFNSMDGIWQIWVMDFNTRTLSYITEGLFPEFCPVVNKKDAKTGTPLYELAYQRHRKRDVPWFSIWTIGVRMGNNGAVEAVNSPQEIISNDQWAAITPVWSPDGKYLAFATVRKSPLTQWQARIYKPDDVWVVRIDGTDLTQITNHNAPDWNPFWAVDPDDPSGPGRLYFTSERTGHANIWSVKPVIAGLLAEQGMRMEDK